MIQAPWTPEQVAALNRYQRNGRFHPFTCRGRDGTGHREYAAAQGEGDHGILIATEQGWICPVCPYTQDWADEFMFKPMQEWSWLQSS